jgi:hypothetical protein
MLPTLSKRCDGFVTASCSLARRGSLSMAAADGAVLRLRWSSDRYIEPKMQTLQNEHL